MFTGIITNTARLKRLRRSAGGHQLLVRPKKKPGRVRTGESIAVNGCCLTVVSYKNNVLAFDLSDETLRKTAFKSLKPGAVLNLERAMKASDRFGGHFVLGHVDGVGRVRSIACHDDAVVFTIAYPKKFSKLLIEKGSVCVDGISLTVCDLKKGAFSVWIIPHTLKQTHLGALKKGDPVNLEFDVLGKYVARIMRD